MQKVMLPTLLTRMGGGAVSAAPPLRRQLTVSATAVVLFGLILWLRLDAASGEDASLVLVVLPIALCAFGFGTIGGLVAGLLAFLGVAVFDAATTEIAVSMSAYVALAVAYVLIGGALGKLAGDQRRSAQALARHRELSRDLVCTADFEGHFTEVNPAWTAVLGYGRRELLSRPFIDFVHPDDRERTAAESASVVSGRESVSFENRYRARDGSYRWLQWTARGVPEERVIYASARDVTEQHEARDLIRRLLAERTRDLDEARLETLRRLALAAEYRDDATHKHTERVGKLAALLAAAAGLSDEFVELVGHAAPLHDVGKLAISDTILLKPGQLDSAEFAQMQTHTTVGASILGQSSSPILRMGEEIALTHHERWDGSGYPRGLCGEQIPISGRIVALADVFDALTHERPYKTAWSVDQAIAEIARQSGRQFDPRIVEAFQTLDSDQARHLAGDRKPSAHDTLSEAA